MAFVAHIAQVDGMTASAELHFREHGYVGLNQIGNDQTNVAIVLPAERAREARNGIERFFEQTLATFPEVRERVHAGRVVRRILATGPFAVRSSHVIAHGAMLVGDAADFFDPATGDGIYSGLRGAELLAGTAAGALRQPGHLTADRLMDYQRSRRRVFAGKWLLERILDQALRFPRLLDLGVSRLGRRPGVADTLIGFAGSCVAPREVLNPVFLARMLL
jgi:flavin-dependent dehydrogenase